MASRRETGIRSLRFVILGTASGIAYAVLNTSMDYLHGRGFVARAFVALHDVVDDVIPVVVGALLGVAVHYLRLRSRVAQEERARADELRARVQHVERDQAVWVVAAATLHELKNPLHAIGLLIDELEHTPATDVDAVADLRARMRAQMERALVPLDGLRALAHARRSEGADASVVEVAELVVRDLSPVMRETGVELRFESTADRSVRADPGFVRIILENLIGNSVDGLRQNTQRRGEICVRVDRSGDRLSLDVSDDGPGLELSAQRSLFHPLQTAKAGGLGLGLSIARALARAMDGDLEHATVPGWSTTFRLILPAPPR
ncbi:MAG: periplasmic sensor signal transduction histidine kinase [Labilithrix sp.]|nr:periplasmic sensor signal transduction histidine kinase [Labilithrix sp.]